MPEPGWRTAGNPARKACRITTAGFSLVRETTSDKLLSNSASKSTVRRIAPFCTVSVKCQLSSKLKQPKPTAISSGMLRTVCCRVRRFGSSSGSPRRAGVLAKGRPAPRSLPRLRRKREPREGRLGNGPVRDDGRLAPMRCALSLNLTHGYELQRGGSGHLAAPRFELLCLGAPPLPLQFKETQGEVAERRQNLGRSAF